MPRCAFATSMPPCSAACARSPRAARNCRTCPTPIHSTKRACWNHAAVIETFAAALPNIERVGGGAECAINYLLPYIRLHAFARRLKRMLACLDAKGAIDPDTGLLANAVFWRDLNRAVDNADKRGAALSIARFSLPAANRRISLEAARLVGR